MSAEPSLEAPASGGPATEPARTGEWPKAVPLLILAGLLAYSNSFTKAFVFDDTVWITGNPDISSLSRSMAGGSRPVVRVTLWLNYALGGLNPTGYHAVNLAVHVLAGLTLYGLIRRTLLLPRFAGRYERDAPYLAFAVALLWLIHPLQTQSVTYVIQRCESMMGLFYLFTLYAWLRGATGGSRWWFVAAPVSFALSSGCKEVAVTLPPVLVLFDRIFLADSWRAVLRRWLPYLAVFGVWAYYLFPAAAGATGGAADTGVGVGIRSATPWTYLLTQSEVILHYVRLSVWPRGQAIDYVDWPIAQSLREVWPSFLVVSAGLFASLVLMYFRPPVGFVFFCFFAFLAPTSSVIPIIDPAFEHRMYLSLAPVVIGVVFATYLVLAAAHWSDRKRAVFGGAAVASAAVVLLPLTYARNETYRTQLYCQEVAVAARPNNPRAWASLAALYINAGQLDRAEQALRRVEELPNHYGLSTLQRAPLLAKSGHLAESEVVYKGVAGRGFYEYESPLVYRQLAWVQLAQGKAGDAVATLRGLLSHQSQIADDHLALAAALLAAGQEPEARAEAAEAVRLDPQVPKRFSAEARLFLLLPDSPGTLAIRPRLVWQAQAACLADGDHTPRLLDTLALGLSAQGRYPEAAEAARRGIAAAEAQGDTDWALALKARLRFYEAGKRYWRD
jgi:tetratricopeptide (TPR) repeat protein